MADVERNGKYAWTTKVGEKGQIVIPKQARELFGIHSGDTLLLLGDLKRGLAIVDSAKFLDLAHQVLDADDPEPGARGQT